MMNAGDYNKLIRQMQEHRLCTPDKRVTIKISGAKNILEESFRMFLNQQNAPFEWLHEYDQVAEWLENNHERGLLLYGDCGRGKSLLTRYVLPAILLKHCNKVLRTYNAQQMNNMLDEVLARKIIGLDDIGTEDVKNDYGNRRLAFSEIMDAVEKQEKLVVISTNLNGEQLLQTYKDRVFERIIATTKRIEFKGKSLRK